MIIFLWSILLSLFSTNVIASDVTTPFDTIARYLLRNDRSKGSLNELKNFNEVKISKALKKLADGQATLKNMDSATHMLNNAMSDKR